MVFATIIGILGTQAPAMMQLFTSYLLVVAVFGLALATVWMLKRINPKTGVKPGDADVRAKAKGGIWDIFIKIKGFAALFIAIVLLTFAGMRFVVSLSGSLNHQNHQWTGIQADAPVHTNESGSDMPTTHLPLLPVSLQGSSVSRTQDQTRTRLKLQDGRSS